MTYILFISMLMAALAVVWLPDPKFLPAWLFRMSPAILGMSFCLAALVEYCKRLKRPGEEDGEQ